MQSVKKSSQEGACALLGFALIPTSIKDVSKTTFVTGTRCECAILMTRQKRKKWATAAIRLHGSEGFGARLGLFIVLDLDLADNLGTFTFDDRLTLSFLSRESRLTITE